MNTKKVELLAPVGNFDCLRAAINNGADAVYLGGKNFSARAFATNFSNEDIIHAVNYAHLKNVKVYVTVNTLLNEKEFNKVIKQIDFYYKNNVDALIIQDLGLYYYIKENYPDFEIHASTQMHVHNLEGVKTVKQLGFKRVVLARESSLDLIKKCCKEDIEVEIFVHGAICVSYSGQCLMSSFSKNRSANKGMCAQCCRLKYDLYENNNKVSTNTDYLLSPSDMYLLNNLPELIEAGVSSFKIEGRMKSSAYVGYVTNLYRKAIDSYYDNKKFNISNEELDNLKVLFNRNFTNGYLNNKYDFFNQSTPNHLGIKIGTVINNQDGYTYIKLDKELNQFDGIRIEDFGCIVNMLYKDKLLVNSGNSNDIVAIQTNLKLKGNVYKTLDYILEKAINEVEDKKLPLDINLYVHADENIIVELKTNYHSYKYDSHIKALKAISAPLNEDSLKKQFIKLNDTNYYLNNFSCDIDNAFLQIKLINQIRREAIENLDKYILSSFSRETINTQIKYINVIDQNNNDLMTKKNNIITVSDTEYIINPVINSDSLYVESKNAVISEIGGILKQYNNKIAYYTLNCSNSYAYEFLLKMGFKYIILSTELNIDNIKDLIYSFNKRLNIKIRPYVLIKGKRTLMYVKANPLDKYLKDYDNAYLSDGFNKYILNKNNNITEIIQDIYKFSDNLTDIINNFEIIE